LHQPKVKKKLPELYQFSKKLDNTRKNGKSKLAGTVTD
jgi:hypothetical protein